MQPFPYYVVLDFEATCDSARAPVPQEIIEFPSVLLKGDTMEVIDTFESFVRPVHHPTLTPFCTELTGISQADVDSADDFSVVYERHCSWLQHHGLTAEDANFAYITCGDWDICKMLPQQMRTSRPPFEFVQRPWRRWVNIKHVFRDALSHRRMNQKNAPGMMGMLRALSLSLEGRHHRGIDDCRNIARIAKALVDRGAVFDLTSALPPTAYPPVMVRVSCNGEQRCVDLKSRTLKCLFGAASPTFRCQVSKAYVEFNDPVKQSTLEDLQQDQQLQMD